MQHGFHKLPMLPHTIRTFRKLTNGFPYLIYGLDIQIVHNYIKQDNMAQKFITHRMYIQSLQNFREN